MDAFNPDLIRTMQQAMELARMFGAGEQSEAGQEPEQKEESNDAENNMMRIFEMMNFIRSFKSENSPQNHTPEPIGFPPGNMQGVPGHMMSNHYATPHEAGKRNTPAGRAEAAGNFDMNTSMPALESIKSAIPHLDGRYQKYMSVFVKVIEIQKMMELYSQAAVTMCSGGVADENWRRNMLNAVKPHMDTDKANMIDFLIKLIEMKEISKRMQVTPKG